MEGAHRFLAKPVGGHLPFADAPSVRDTPPPLIRRAGLGRELGGDSQWAGSGASDPSVVLQMAPGYLVLMRTSALARLLYVTVAFAGLFAGFGVTVALITLGHLASGELSLVVGLAVVMWTPGGLAVGAVGARGLLKIRPRSPGYPLEIAQVTLGAVVQNLDLVWPGGAVSVRVVARRRRVVQALRATGLMPAPERVYEWGPFA